MIFVTYYFCYLKEKNKKILVFKTKGPVIIYCLKGGGGVAIGRRILEGITWFLGGTEWGGSVVADWI